MGTPDWDRLSGLAHDIDPKSSHDEAYLSAQYRIHFDEEFNGEWESPVIRLLWEQEIASPNLASPTISEVSVAQPDRAQIS